VKRLLKRLGGVEVTCVSDGKATLEHCTRCVDGKLQHPDIILMDCQMPLMNGLEATVAIRRLRDEKMSRVPIVAVSSGIKSMNKLACVEAGMDDYVAKPLNQETLASALMNNLPSELIKDDMNARILTL
jgi:CheY-like chemotaxis protein